MFRDKNEKEKLHKKYYAVVLKENIKFLYT